MGAAGWGELFIVSAPSGAGKTTLVNRLIEKIGPECGLSRLVTYTSRAPRPGEQEGVDYYYLSKPDFEQKIREGFFLEWSGALDNYYGTGKAAVCGWLAQGKSGILILDRPGALKVQKAIPATLIWVTVPSSQVLAQRLALRGAETVDQITQRLARAAQEIDEEVREKKYDQYLENDDLERSLSDFEKIVRHKLQRADKKV